MPEGMRENYVGEPAWDDWAPYYDIADGDRGPFIEFYGSLITDKI